MNKHFAIPIGGLATAAMAVALLLLAGPAAAAQMGPQPSPATYRSKFGSMKFPKKFPAGTKIEITQWSHFVPRYDKWFDKYAQEWGKANNVDVTVNHINLADLASSLSSAIAAKKGSTLFEMLAPPSAFIEGLQPLNKVNKAAAAAFGKRTSVCKHSSYLPIKKEWYGFCHGWVPDPGDYRVSLWKDAGYPHGPITYNDLLKGATAIYKKHGIPSGGGMAPEIDAEYFARSVIWSFGGSIQNRKGQVVFDSPQVLKAVKFVKEFHKSAQTPEVFTWNAASNNQVYIAGQASYIQNSISFFRSAQQVHPDVANDTGFRPGLKGPGGQVHQTAHVYFIYVMPKYVTNKNTKEAAEKFMLDLEANYSNATYNSKLYNFPAFPSQVPQLTEKGGWLDHDPFGSQPPNKLEVLRSAPKWTAWLGYPGYANPAISEIYHEHLLSAMMAEVAQGKKSPEAAVKDTTAQMKKIFAKWRKKGYVLGGQ
ncbi:MAG TPA: ABC transporter substrate-binding protein [Gammaproteobacteria bacterium]|nr:ABC transporter substrate-binding protein [Gammaproteobacteria bacterium]HYW93288.1 ABC transporter substrate-binding protein [Gammaproteobacteria bacterium]